MKYIRVFGKLLAFTSLCLMVIPTQLLVLAFDKGRFSYFIPYHWHKAVCWVFGLKLETQGTPYTNSQTIYVCNHTSYLDIPLIGSVLKASFVAKKEVASWPVFGLLSKLQQTAFISRDKEDAAKEKNALSNMMAAGKSLIIFPEGTSTDGKEVLPFKSSLFSLAYGDYKNLMIQPITLEISEVNSQKPEKQDIRDLYSWHNKMDIDLSLHLIKFSECKGAKVKLIFHDAFAANSYENRKTLAKACHESVSNGLANNKNKKQAA